jgi:hypothetical protein
MLVTNRKPHAEITLKTRRAMLWTGTYQGKRVWFLTSLAGTPVSSPEVWWVSRAAVIEAEKADCRALRSMNHLRAKPFADMVAA